MRKINYLTFVKGIVLLCFVIPASGTYADEVRDWSKMPGSGTSLCMLEYEGRLYPYRIFFPSTYRHAPDEEGGDIKKFPLVIACHPAGGDEIAYFEWKGNSDRIQTIAEKRGYVVACPAGPDGAWHVLTEGPAPAVAAKPETPAIIMALLQEITKQRQIDMSRVYLMGASSGALVTYATAAANPDTFAAIAGVCGTFPEEAIDKLKQTPTLIFNARKDKLIPIQLMRERAHVLEKAGGKVKFVETSRGHGGYRDLETYALLFDWFEAHRRKSPKQKRQTRSERRSKEQNI
ncbi:MAG: prolyl oligopeptidase family serine peptidase [Phycisphaerales bacterium]|nr:MAG: prolyl oligopeptidase family serine peptidase [Phycisphaerales bacterium]